MSLLAHDDYELFLDCIRDLHAFREAASLRAWLLDTALPKLIPSDWLSYNEVDLLHPENTLAILKPESNRIFHDLFPRFQEVAHQHPLIVRQMRSPDFPVHKISDFLDQEAYHQLELYRDVYRHMGVEYQMAATLKLEPNRVTALALSRRACDYTERDRAVLEMLRPHLVIAFNNVALTCERQIIAESADLALNELSAATLVVDPNGHILYHAGPGVEWIGATCPGILPAPIARWLNRPGPSACRPVMNWVSPAHNIRIRAVPTNHPERRLLVLTKEQDRSSAAVPSVDYGLTNRELEVGRWIGQGKTNAEIGAILGISPRTVHKHVEHILDKLGVETRVAVAVRLRD